MTTNYRIIVVSDWDAFVNQWPLTDEGLRQPPCVLAGHQAGPSEEVTDDEGNTYHRLLPGKRAIWGAMTADQRASLLAMDGVWVYTTADEVSAAHPDIDLNLLHGFMGQS